MTMDPTHKAPRNWFRNADYYVGWYVFWGMLFSIILPASGSRPFWTAKIHQAMFGAGFGLACALMFMILQNGFNRSRTKSISWIFAIGSWAVLSMLIALTMGILG
jgi:hypothetical protein